MTIQELNQELLELRRRQFNLRLRKIDESLKQTHLIKQLRRSIARIKTFLTVKGGDCGK